MNYISILTDDLNQDYASETRKARRKGSGGTQEFFTPFSLCHKMADKISDDIWKDPTKTFIDPASGNGQFLLTILERRIVYGIEWRQALETLYGTELMADNVEESKLRLLKLLDDLGVDYDREEARAIMDRNIICTDFFKWDYLNWCPMEEKTKK